MRLDCVMKMHASKFAEFLSKAEKVLKPFS